ncbi:winged helix-turn-helix domain-containing protein [Salipaludibacillus sp. LMS25]|jgi:DNA-binding winged helix-turn-helix (wHTH) protein|uniref:winged helix-turn-helix domain-containing protein n=1 Tax=Salipaludibacillus sp. LMS25 TaxID=2924031 RepID=UPI0020D16A0F|nr:winged helix-turn-helix domain-containing protein [Salipaludibacillus sp. LMS25]UTR16455.1 winged helix-turn-helix domain-containing protein [Salipaludibacillus sp. LMS25]
MTFIFQPNDLTVTHGNDTITFLRKEYALLHYLYTHDGKSFSRDALLDAVWPSESPSDRTVDDHIYRLRKKLKPWEQYVSIETIKGYGYQLVLHGHEEHSPLVHDDEFKQLTSQLYSKYHLYGQGEALEALVLNKAFGISLDEWRGFHTAFIKGDFQAILYDQELPFSEKALYVFHVAFIFCDDVQCKRLFRTFEQGLQTQLFSPRSIDEAQTLAAPHFAIWVGDLAKAEHYLTEADNTVSSVSHGFYPYLQLMHMFLSIAQEQPTKFEILMEKMAVFFAERPYQRELGLYYVIQGLFFITQEQFVTGRATIHKGLQITKKTRFTSHLFLTLRTALFFLEHYVEDRQTERELTRLWEELTDGLDLPLIAAHSEQVILEHIHP